MLEHPTIDLSDDSSSSSVSYIPEASTSRDLSTARRNLIRQISKKVVASEFVDLCDDSGVYSSNGVTNKFDNNMVIVLSDDSGDNNNSRIDRSAVKRRVTKRYPLLHKADEYKDDSSSEGSNSDEGRSRNAIKKLSKARELNWRYVTKPNIITLRKLKAAKKNMVEKRKASDESSNNDTDSENVTEDRKAKALENVTKLLNLSKKYANLFQSRFVLLNNNESSAKETQTVKNDEEVVDFNKAKYFKGTLHPYQIDGVNWLRTLFKGDVSGILADEMGLGKTVQVIALLAHLTEKGVNGPHLVIAPLSTLANWKSEFKRFAPDLPVIVFQGNKEERLALRSKVRIKKRVDDIDLFPTMILSYQTALREWKFLRGIKWRYMVIDEAHRIKNHKSQLAVAVRKFDIKNKLLLTGTPLQNNMTELWALLNFIMPHIFSKVDTFSTIFMLEDFEDEKFLSECEQNDVLVTAIHKILEPFMLRRLKTDVLDDIVPKEERLVQCPMSQQQHNLYTHVLKRTMESLLHNGKDKEIIINAGSKKRKCSKNNYKDFYGLEESENFVDAVDIVPDVPENYFAGKTNKFIHSFKMQSPMMMFRKIVDHPYLVSMPLIPGKKEILVDANLICQSGKMMVLHAMLRRLKQQKHKVLIFSTLYIMLDLIEEYLIMEDYKYSRLDGSIKYEERQANIDNFNNNPDVFIFLITTRAGGLGINLTAADTVIFFDRDWNPQSDKQAQARCHRIGQTKPVMIYSLVTKNTIDERVISCGEMKVRLEKLVIKEAYQSNCEKMDQYKEILKIIEDNKLNTIIHPDGTVFTDDELDALLDRSALHRKWKAQKKDHSVK